MPIITQTTDASGNPVITLCQDSSPGAGDKTVVVLIKPYATGTATDVFGNTANAYTPHVIQICTEANYASTVATPDYLTPVELLPVICEVAKKGCITEWHVTTNTTIPSEAAITAGTNLKARWYPSLNFSIQSAQ
jgi:hypothetical protein